VAGIIGALCPDGCSGTTATHTTCSQLKPCRWTAPSRCSGGWRAAALSTSHHTPSQTASVAAPQAQEGVAAPLGARSTEQQQGRQVHPLGRHSLCYAALLL
jgi:hypothetical protein